MENNRYEQQKQFLSSINNYFSKNNYLNQNSSQTQIFQGGMNTMRLTGMYSMNKDKTTMNLMGMTMNQFNNPLSLNSSLMANSGSNMTYFNNNNDDKEEKYIGKIVNGFRHGKGTLYYKNGSLKYEGDFAYDNFEGNGKCVYENGCYYIGEFKKV